jgi:hypothetical protein
LNQDPRISEDFQDGRLICRSPFLMADRERRRPAHVLSSNPIQSSNPGSKTPEAATWLFVIRSCPKGPLAFSGVFEPGFEDFGGFSGWVVDMQIALPDGGQGDKTACSCSFLKSHSILKSWFKNT